MAYTLPVIFVAAWLDGNGIFRFQVSREGVPVTWQLGLSMMINTDKK